MLPTLKIIHVKDNRKIGWATIYLQYIFNRKVNRISLKINIPENSWQGTDRFIHERGEHSINNARTINKYLNEVLIKSENILLSWEDETTINFNAFKSRLLRNKPVSFFEYHNLYLDEQRKKDLGETTFITYGTQMNRINRYQKNLLISEITEPWILKFEHTMRTDWGLDINSIYKVMIYMRSVLNLAKKNGDLSSNPFEYYEVKKVVREKHFLNREEVRVLEKLYEGCVLRSSLQKVLEQFLFACYTGLAYADLKKMRYEDITEIENTWVLSGIRQKSKNSHPLKFTVPLIDKAVSILDLEQKTGVAFKAISNQKTNVYLKEICRFVGINKKVTFHTARHTCGTILINLGVPKHVVQQILGHKKSEMTDHYAKLVDKTVIDQIKILNKNWN